MEGFTQISLNPRCLDPHILDPTIPQAGGVFVKAQEYDLYGQDPSPSNCPSSSNAEPLNPSPSTLNTELAQNPTKSLDPKPSGSRLSFSIACPAGIQFAPPATQFGHWGVEFAVCVFYVFQLVEFRV